MNNVSNVNCSEMVTAEMLKCMNIHAHLLNLKMSNVPHTTINKKHYFDRAVLAESILRSLGWSGVTYAFAIIANVSHVDLVNDCITENMRHRTCGGKLTMYSHCFGEFIHRYLKLYEKNLSDVQKKQLANTRKFVVEIL